MKRFYLLLLLLAGAPFALLGQVHRGFTYQSYLRDASGMALGGVSASIRLTVYSPDNSSAVTYQETHTLTTDPYGLYMLVVGSRNPTSFARVDFGAENYWMRVEQSVGGAAFVESSNERLPSVPFARAANNGVEPGTILVFAGAKSQIPAGFLACDGSAYNTANFPRLFAAIGYAWGGAGILFRVPDLRGVFLRGHNDGRTGDFADPDANTRVAVNGGASGDRVGSFQGDGTRIHSHTGQTSEDGAHSHNTTWPWSSSSGGDGDISILRSRQSPNESLSFNTSRAGNHTHPVTINNTGNLESRPVNASVYFIIKY